MLTHSSRVAELQPPVEQLGAAGEALSQFRTVGHCNQDGVFFVVKVEQQVGDGSSRVTVEVACRLVGQDERRTIDQRPSDGNTLALSP